MQIGFWRFTTDLFKPKECLLNSSFNFSIKYARFVFTLVAGNEAKLPLYKGSTLRGALGHAFKRLVCRNRHGLCPKCMFISNCAYAYVFETPSSSVETHLNQLFIPHPFLIEPPTDGKQVYAPGDRLEFVLLLIGKGLDYLPFFIASFDHAAARGLGASRTSFALIGVDQVYGGLRIPVWRGGTCLVTYPRPEELVDAAGTTSWTGEIDGGITCQRQNLFFQTPTRLYKGGRPARSIEFGLLMRSIFRRLDLLGRAHGGGPLNLPFRELLEQAGAVSFVEYDLVWTDWSRFSERQGKHVMMGGYVGRATFIGNIDSFLPYIRMAEVMHVGKGTVYGMGKMQVL